MKWRKWVGGSDGKPNLEIGVDSDKEPETDIISYVHQLQSSVEEGMQFSREIGLEEYKQSIWNWGLNHWMMPWVLIFDPIPDMPEETYTALVGD